MAMGTPLTPEEIEELKRLYKELYDVEIIDTTPLKNAKILLEQMRREYRNLNGEIHNFAETLDGIIHELNNYKSTVNLTKKAFGDIQDITSKLNYDQIGITRLHEKDIKKLKEKLDIDIQRLRKAKDYAAIRDDDGNLIGGEALELQNRITAFGIGLTDKQIREKNKLKKQLDKVLEAEENINAILGEQEENHIRLKNLIDERLINENKVQKALGLTGGFMKMMESWPGFKEIFNADDAIESMEGLADEIIESGKDVTTLGNRTKVAAAGFKILGQQAKTALTDPVAIFLLLTKAALDANGQVVELGKSLGTAGEGYRERIADMSRANINFNTSVVNLVESFKELAQVTGFAYEFSEDQLVTQTRLTKQVGLQAEEAAQIQRLAVLNGKTSEQTYRNFLKGITAARNQVRVGIDFKATLAEATKVSGQLAANLGYSPQRIGEAVVKAKALGLTLEETREIGNSLLDFESSLSNQLEAILLTGRQINLDRARYLALQGDIVGVAEEITSQGVTAENFAKMNVLQQKSLAQAYGMQTDQLAEQLRKREEAIASGKSLAQLSAEEVQQNLERQKITEKFEAAILKIKELIGNLVAGPLGTMIDVLADALHLVNGIMSGIQGIMGSPATKVLLGALGGFVVSGFNPIGALVGGGLGLASGLQTGNDIISTPGKSTQLKPKDAIDLSSGLDQNVGTQANYGNRKLITPDKTIALNNKDTVIAGTNLFPSKKDDSKEVSQFLDLDKLMQKLNVNIESKQPNITFEPKIEQKFVDSINIEPLIEAIKSIKIDENLLKQNPITKIENIVKTDFNTQSIINAINADKDSINSLVDKFSNLKQPIQESLDITPLIKAINENKIDESKLNTKVNVENNVENKSIIEPLDLKPLTESIKSISLNNEPLVTPIDFSPLIQAIVDVKTEIKNLKNQQINVNLDGRKVGTGIYNASGKTA